MKNWIVADPEHLGGSPRVRDMRISVALILESLAAGLSVADIVDAYPSRTEESVRDTLAELAYLAFFLAMALSLWLVPPRWPSRSQTV